jgi:hypothetical protein
MLAEAGIQLWDWPHILSSLPYAKGKGMQAMGSANLLVLIDAFRNGLVKARLVNEAGKLLWFNAYHYCLLILLCCRSQGNDRR